MALADSSKASYPRRWRRPKRRCCGTPAPGGRRMTERKKVSLPLLFQKAEAGQPITMLTCYDFPTGTFQEQAGIDIVLVGDSLGMTMLGYESTLPVTMDDMIRHSQAVRRGTPNAWLIGDMPYMSYQASVESAIRNAGRFMAEAACDAIKLEGGIEMVPDRVCGLITERAEHCLIISLGSGPHAHGQLLIYHDMFGLYPRFRPRMAKVFGEAGKVILGGLQQYVKEVSDRSFPQPENWFGMGDDEYTELLDLLG